MWFLSSREIITNTINTSLNASQEYEVTGKDFLQNQLNSKLIWAEVRLEIEKLEGFPAQQ